MPPSYDYVHSLSYELYPSANQAEFDFAVSYALAGKAAARSELELGAGSFVRRQIDGGCELHWIFPPSLLPEQDYEELLALAWQTEASRICRHGDTNIARTCRITARLEYESRAVLAFNSLSKKVGKGGGSSLEHFSQVVNTLTEADIQDMYREGAWTLLVHRLAGLFLAIDEVQNVGEAAEEIVRGLANSHGTWSKRTRVDEYRKFIEGL